MSGLAVLLMVVGYVVIGVIAQGIYEALNPNKKYPPPLFIYWGIFIAGVLIFVPFYLLYEGANKFTKWIISKKETKQLTQNHKRAIVEDKELEEAYAEVEQELNSDKPFKQFTK